MDGVEGKPDSLPVWIYGAAAGGVVLIVATATIAGHFLWRRKKRQESTERNAMLKAEFIENLTPRKESEEK
uniref:Uncharacterized protein n=1 Tax=viral metagenome TaxID=1070528 RepID=A0A6C0CJ93_9ZZZZ